MLHGRLCCLTLCRGKPSTGAHRFVFDEQQGVDVDVEMFFSEMIKSLPAEAQNLIDGLPAFKSDKELQYAPLQAPDFLAWHLRREHETGERLARTNGLISLDAHLVQEIPDEMLRSWASHHATLPGVPLLQSKQQWKDFKTMMKTLTDAGIDPSKINGAGIYYPEGTSALARAIDWVRRRFGHA